MSPRVRTARTYNSKPVTTLKAESPIVPPKPLLICNVAKVNFIKIRRDMFIKFN